MKLCAVHSADTMDSNGRKQKRENRCKSSSKHSAKTPVRHLGTAVCCAWAWSATTASYSRNTDFPKAAKPPHESNAVLCLHNCHWSLGMKISGKNGRVPRKSVLKAWMLSVTTNEKNKCAAYNTIQRSILDL